MDILCVGQLVADILVKPVDGVDYSVDTKRVEQIVVKNGGDSMNTAIALAKLENKVGFAGKVGDDSFGKYLMEVISSCNIDVSGLKITKDAATSSVIVLINSKGERTFLYYGGANDKFAFEDIDLSLLDVCKIVHAGGTYLLPGFDGKGAAELFKLARSRGKLTSMDVTWDTTGRWLEVIRPCLGYLDYFMPSYNEAVHITGRENPKEIAQFLLEQGVGTVVLKLGKDGCYVKGKDVEFYHSAYDVKVADTTGAGDSFVAGFLTGLKKKWSLSECAQFASAVSACCIQQLGATMGVRNFNGTLDFIKSY
jgi:sugar/nucleoside kinase (ribokinase family)